MPIIWPVSLPVAPLEKGYNEGIPDNTLRSGNDAGPAKVRRKAGLIPFPMAVAMLCTSAQVDDLQTFVNTTLSGGALRFEWTHPRTGLTIDARFLPNGNKLVDLVPSGPFRWTATFTLEILP